MTCLRSQKDKNGWIDIFHLMPHLTFIGLQLILVLFYPSFTWLDIFWTFVIWHDRVQLSLHVLFQVLLLMMVQNLEWLFLSFGFIIKSLVNYVIFVTWYKLYHISHGQNMKPEKVFIHNSSRTDWYAPYIDFIYHSFLCCQGWFPCIILIIIGSEWLIMYES